MMDSAQYVFVTGTARSGSTLLGQILNAHPAIQLASDPYLPLFRLLRNRVIDTAPQFRPYQTRPFQDYYFSPERIALLDLILNAELDLSFDPKTLPLSQLEARLSHESPDLAPYISQLGGNSIGELFQSAMRLINQVRANRHTHWIGIKDVWIAEFFPALTRYFPNAKFIILHRDPRAVVASMRNIAKHNPDQVGHTLSYARHWRKTVALGHYLSEQPLLKERLFNVRYEDLVSDSHKSAAAICQFLDIAFEPAMLNPNNFYDYKTGAIWKGNSSFQTEKSEIDQQSTDVWQAKLPVAVRRVIDFVCQYEMRLMSYSPLEDVVPTHPDILTHILENHGIKVNWRSDFEDPPRDYGYEVFRHMLPRLDMMPQTAMVREAFLFETVFRQIQSLPDIKLPRKR